MTVPQNEPLEVLYTRMHTDSCIDIVNTGVRPDEFLRNPEADGRFGLTLLIEIDSGITGSLFSIIEEIKRFEPDQYYYPATDLHITVLDLIAAHEGFRCDEMEIEAFCSMAFDVVKEVAPFDILFKGLILSLTGVLVKGYYRQGLPTLRDRIRREAGKRRIVLRERYQSISAHASLMRFSSPLADRERLLQFMERSGERSIGRMTVRNCTLVIHDWYNRRKAVIGRFPLAGGEMYEKENR